MMEFDTSDVSVAGQKDTHRKRESKVKKKHNLNKNMFTRTCNKKRLLC